MLVPPTHPNYSCPPFSFMSCRWTICRCTFSSHVENSIHECRSAPQTQVHTPPLSLSLSDWKCCSCFPRLLPGIPYKILGGMSSRIQLRDKTCPPQRIYKRQNNLHDRTRPSSSIICLTEICALPGFVWDWDRLTNLRSNAVRRHTIRLPCSARGKWCHGSLGECGYNLSWSH